MKTDGSLLCSNVPGRSMHLRQFFCWPTCVISGHQWKKKRYWDMIGKGSVICHHCCAVQYLTEVPRDWNGEWKSRRLDVFGAFLSIIATLLILISFLNFLFRS